MDLYDSIKELKENENLNEIEKYEKLSSRFAEQGFTQRDVTDLLMAEGCSKDNAKKIAQASMEKLPAEYYINYPPNSFEDIASELTENIKKASLEDVEKYFDIYQNKNFENIKNNIIIAKNDQTKSSYKQAMDALKPLIEDLILAGKALSNDDNRIDYMDEKEKMEQDLFGLWPVYLIQKRAAIDKADVKLSKRTDIKPGDNISFI